jgi:glycine/D-amino acid oxidase-like deaminating enzyme/nitrite reductase/ring-hydroxylating ferredoxin subunit
MNDTSKPTLSFWAVGADVPAAAKLTRDVRADVCVVGAGIAGLTTAYLLTRAGRNVAVLDAGPPGAGETERTTAHLTSVLDMGYASLAKLHGEQAARLAAESHSAAIDEIESIVRAESIDCGFERLDGYLFETPGAASGGLDEDLEAAHRAGLLAVEKVKRAPIAGFDSGPALRFPRQGQFHPLRYIAGLARAIVQAGGSIYGEARARDFEGGKAASVTTDRGHTVKADAIVVATNTPVNDRLVIHTKQAAYRSYVIAGRVARDSVTRALFWDTADPYHYVRLHSEPGQSDDVLVVGGEDHKTGQAGDADDADARFERLESWGRERFPSLEKVRYRWSGQVLEPMDGLAFIGKNPGTDTNVYVTTGSSGNGMTYGTIAGMLLTDLIHARANEWAEIYDPGRISLRAAKEFLKQNLNVAVQYAQHAKGGGVGQTGAIAPGTGAIEQQGRDKLAVYRDDKGRLHKLSAICPHLGCLVKWNAVESSWDCPCHGSRFTPDGRVLNGPALTALAPAPEDA